jgi:hypothetical protein
MFTDDEAARNHVLNERLTRTVGDSHRQDRLHLEFLDRPRPPAIAIGSLILTASGACE